MAPRVRCWIAEILIDEEHEAKLRQRRFLTWEEVREAVVPDRYEEARWEDHPRHGRRLLLTGRTYEGKRLKIILEPLDEAEGTWLLRTALHASP